MDEDANTGRPYVARVPMMAAATAFGAGVAAQRVLFHPVWLWLSAALLLGGAAFYFRVRRAYVGFALALMAMACAGAFTSEARESVPKDRPGLARYSTGDKIVLTGTVVRDGVIRPGAFGSPSESIDLQVERVETVDGEFAVEGGARLNLYVPAKSYVADEDAEAPEAAASKIPLYLFGQRLRVTAKLHAPLNFRNPGAFDYAGYLDGLGITALGSAKSSDVEVLSGVGGSVVERWRWSARRRVLEQIHRVWPPEQVALFDAMVIGERAYLSHETQAEFQRSGTYHILVVSGMNVGIFAVFIYWILRRVRAGVEVATVLTILMALSYALLTDLGSPILRSIAMLSVYQVTKVFYRDRAALNAVGTAALAMLVWEPRQLFDASFQLTFLSVAAIAGICVPLLERSAAPYRAALRQLGVKGYDQAFAPKLAQWRIDLRMIEQRLERLFGTTRAGRWMAWKITTAVPGAALAAFELMLVSAMMQLALALPMAWYFHRLPFRAFWANLAVVPLTGVLMPACVVAVALSFASMWLAKLPALVASYALLGITGTVHALGASGPHDVRLARPETWIAVASGTALALAMLVAKRRRWAIVTAMAALAISTAWLAAPRAVQARTRALEITAIDVGQGEALLIVTPEGKTILLDAGGPLGFSQSEFDVGEQVTSSYLWNRGIDHLDVVAFSHPHSDHMQGMAAVIANFRPKELWMGARVDNALTRNVERACREYGVTEIQRRQGDAWMFGGAKFEVLAEASPDEIDLKQLDDSSMVLRASFGKTSILLPGDAHRKVELKLAQGDPAADVLKIAHHGSATSTSQELLIAVKPRFALISVGRDNPFGHPRSDVLKRLADAKVRTYRTDLFGPVTFYLDGEQVTPSVPR